MQLTQTWSLPKTGDARKKCMQIERRLDCGVSNGLDSLITDSDRGLMIRIRTRILWRQRSTAMNSRIAMNSYSCMAFLMRAHKFWVISRSYFVCEILSQHTFQADTSIVKAFLIIFTSRFADLNKPSIKSTWSNYVLTNSIGCQSEAFDDHSPEFNRLSLYKSFYKEL